MRLRWVLLVSRGLGCQTETSVLVIRHWQDSGTGRISQVRRGSEKGRGTTPGMGGGVAGRQGGAGSGLKGRGVADQQNGLPAESLLDPELATALHSSLQPERCTATPPSPPGRGHEPAPCPVEPAPRPEPQRLGK